MKRPGAVLLAAFMAATCTRGSSQGTLRKLHPSLPKQNIVLVLTDDQRWDEISRMPNVQTLLAAHGVTFSEAFVVDSLCCPSRATIMSGKYSHGTDIYSNHSPHGGYKTWMRSPAYQSNLATWLHGSGYRTGLMGKYLNGYAPGDVTVPPGWDDWHALELTGGGDEAGGYYDYTTNDNGIIGFHGESDADYSTDVLSGDSVSFIKSTPRSRPLFLYFAPRAPHGPTTPPRRYAAACSDLPPLRPPNYDTIGPNEPAWVQALRPLGANRTAVDEAHLNHCRSLLAVDDAVGNIVAALTATSRLANTLFVFMSDNGLSLGEHRWVSKKVTWEESIRVPLIIRDDAIVAHPGTVDDRFALNVDLAPTFAEAAATKAPGAEGVSLVPLLAGVATRWRTDFLVEHWQMVHQRGDDVVPP
jgi:N-acetylglucosamine-6-sulfatase